MAKVKSAAAATARGESAHFIPLFDQPLRFRARAVVAGDGMALAEQRAHHLAAHHAQADKSKIRHPLVTSELLNLEIHSFRRKLSSSIMKFF